MLAKLFEKLLETLFETLFETWGVPPIRNWISVVNRPAHSAGMPLRRDNPQQVSRVCARRRWSWMFAAIEDPRPDPIEALGHE
jgi:hypothetical protein